MWDQHIIRVPKGAPWAPPKFRPKGAPWASADGEVKFRPLPSAVAAPPIPHRHAEGPALGPFLDGDPMAPQSPQHVADCMLGGVVARVTPPTVGAAVRVVSGGVEGAPTSVARGLGIPWGDRLPPTHPISPDEVSVGHLGPGVVRARQPCARAGPPTRPDPCGVVGVGRRCEQLPAAGSGQGTGQRPLAARLDECFEWVLVCSDVFWVCSGCVLVCSGCVLGVFWVCSGCVLGVFWVCSGLLKLNLA